MAAPAFRRMARLRVRLRDPALTTLLVVQCLTIFGLVPLAATSNLVSARLVGILPLLFSAIVVLTSHGRWAIATGGLALALSIAVAILEHVQHGNGEAFAEDGLAAATIALLSAVVFKAVFAPGRFNGHRVLGSIVLYLNLGLLFTLAERAIEHLFPGAYSHLPPDARQASLRAALTYFSFSALTSVGYGDIAPVHPIARSVASIEAVLGHLYPATLLARAVTRAMHRRGE